MMKRIFIFLLNWMLILTIPVWGGTLLIVMMLLDVIEDDGIGRRVLTGKKFLFD